MLKESHAYLLAIDQGTTSTRAMVFDSRGKRISGHTVSLRQSYPANGWVEHDAEEVWQAVTDCCREAARDVAPLDISAIGITNQRETTVLWDRATGRPLHEAIVWQDRRTAPRCQELRAEGRAALIASRTGLVIDPYFSATKLEWLLNHVPQARARAEKGQLCFGTIDAWLIYRLTGGRVHATDATNASRTMLFNIHSQDWDNDLLGLFGVPRAILPQVRDCVSGYGTSEILGAPIRIVGVAGDQ
jgi:glycerol kinase